METHVEVAPILTSTRQKRQVCSIKCVGVAPRGTQKPLTMRSKPKQTYSDDSPPQKPKQFRSQPSTACSCDQEGFADTWLERLSGRQWNSISASYGRNHCALMEKEIGLKKHRDVARKILLEGGWTQKRLFDIGGRTTVSVKLVRWRKAQKSTGSTTVWNGTH